MICKSKFQLHASKHSCRELQIWINLKKKKKKVVEDIRLPFFPTTNFEQLSVQIHIPSNTQFFLQNFHHKKEPLNFKFYKRNWPKKIKRTIEFTSLKVSLNETRWPSFSVSTRTPSQSKRRADGRVFGKEADADLILKEVRFCFVIFVEELKSEEDGTFFAMNKWWWLNMEGLALTVEEDEGNVGKEREMGVEVIIKLWF